MTLGPGELDGLVMALLRACQYSLVGIGFAMLIANTRIVNFAHGYIMLLACWVSTLLLGVSFLGTGIAGVVLTVLVLMVFLSIGLQRLYGTFDRGSGASYGDRILIGTAGVGFAIEGFVNLMTGGQALRFQEMGDAQYRSAGWAGLLALALLALLLLDRSISPARRLPGFFCTGLLEEAPSRYYVLTLTAIPALLGLIAFSVLEIGRVLTPWLQARLTGVTQLRWGYARLPMILLTLAFLIVTSLVLRMRIGLMVRACNSDRSLAVRLGISLRRIEQLVFVYSASVAGIGAIFVGFNSDSVRLSFGFRWTLLGFCCALAGRLSMAGIAGSAVLLGLVEYICLRFSDGRIWEAPGFVLLALYLLVSRGEISWGVRDEISSPRSALRKMKQSHAS